MENRVIKTRMQQKHDTSENWVKAKDFSPLIKSASLTVLKAYAPRFIAVLDTTFNVWSVPIWIYLLLEFTISPKKLGLSLSFDNASKVSTTTEFKVTITSKFVELDFISTSKTSFAHAPSS